TSVPQVANDHGETVPSLELACRGRRDHDDQRLVHGDEVERIQSLVTGNAINGGVGHRNEVALLVDFVQQAPARRDMDITLQAVRCGQQDYANGLFDRPDTHDLTPSLTCFPVFPGQRDFDNDGATLYTPSST